MKNSLLKILLVVLSAVAFSATAGAQFKEEAFTQTYADPSDTTSADTTANMFSFKNYFRGLAHKEEVKIGALTAGSAVFVGGGQIYNRQYWKLPVIYGGLGATIATGIHYSKEYDTSLDKKDKHMSQAMFAGAALIYWASLADGAKNYNRDIEGIQPGKSTVYSLLLPGLGQAYNGEYWKIPVYWAGLLGSTHFYLLNRKNYQRYRWIYKEATENEDYDGPVTAENALYYRNVYRRYRDYSIVAIAGFYLLQVIDANVFAYMQDFEIDDELSMRVSPTILTTDNQYAFGGGSDGAKLGVRIGLTF
ncbi:MAG: hypothetical protein K5984_00995 [Bacteroidales bacterium]|nr:hypothetical protein [Bacteroidales bacterium]